MGEPTPNIIVDYKALLASRELHWNPTHYFDLYPLSTVADTCIATLKANHRVSKSVCPCGLDHTDWAREHVLALLGHSNETQHPYGIKILEWMVDSAPYGDGEVDSIEFAITFGLEHGRLGDASRAIKRKMGFPRTRNHAYWKVPSMKGFLLASLGAIGESGIYPEGAWNITRRAMMWMVEEKDVRFLDLLVVLRNAHVEGRLFPMDDPLKLHLPMNSAFMLAVVAALGTQQFSTKTT